MKQLYKEIIKADRLDGEACIQRQKLCSLFIPYLDFSDFNERFVDVETYKDDISIEMSTDGLVFADYFSRNIDVRLVHDFIKSNGYISYAQFISYSF